MIHGFIKFSKLEHLKKMLIDGELYCNRIATIIKNEGKHWGDKFEGVNEIENYSQGKLSLFDENAKEYVSIPNIKRIQRLKRYKAKFNNILCLYTIDNFNIKNNHLIVDDRMKGYGENALIIYNPALFYKKIKNSCAELNIELCSQKVHYYNELNNQTKLTLFDKIKAFEGENEFRFLFETDGSKILKLNIGSMKDYAKIINTKDLINKVHPPKITNE
ncbi:hypothetical protein [Leeuwenhoekiella sp. ZYFB001]|uniref:hypothetical protein n=1 Tax=Leeuwenhoekiella sp. ZYFB001 TaxID=2719912 RepID=UPI0014318054|nr:hypothetical protein [Leeuwenhoekiella sp. ZYFB001]